MKWGVTLFLLLVVALGGERLCSHALMMHHSAGATADDHSHHQHTPHSTTHNGASLSSPMDKDKLPCPSDCPGGAECAGYILMAKAILSEASLAAPIPPLPEMFSFVTLVVAVSPPLDPPPPRAFPLI